MGGHWGWVGDPPPRPGYVQVSINGDSKPWPGQDPLARQFRPVSVKELDAIIRRVQRGRRHQGPAWRNAHDPEATSQRPATWTIAGQSFAASELMEAPTATA